MSASTQQSAARPIVVRKMGFGFEDVPVHWFMDDAYTTHVTNGINMLFPAGERFFIRSVKHYLPRLKDKKLIERVRAFFGQEGSHGHEHERAFEILEAQGFEIREWLQWYERVAFDTVEPKVPPNLRLSITVALEHFTATMAERGLTSGFIDKAHPAMAQLLKWHAAEEIEHKSVAFDVLKEVDGRYWVRIAGLVVAAAGLMYFWRGATKMLLQQEGPLDPEAVARAKSTAKAWGHDNSFIRRAFLKYLRPSFHPDDDDNYHLARDYLRSVGRLAA